MIASSDVKSLTSAQGVGKKTAERIVLELKDKVPKAFSIQPSDINEVQVDAGTQKDALDALLSLGYTRSEAQAVLKQIDISHMTIEDIIKTALRKLMY